jgi:hypothetical protein
MNSTVIIGYGWHHISVISLHEDVELYWHRDIQTRLSDKKKREISDYLNDTLTNPCGLQFAKTTAIQH